MIIRKCGDGVTMFVQVESSDFTVNRGQPARMFVEKLEKQIPGKHRHEADNGYYLSADYENLIRTLKSETFPADENQQTLFQ